MTRARACIRWALLVTACGGGETAPTTVVHASEVALDRERESIAHGLETPGMTESERDAFLCAWETELRTAPAPRAAPRIHHDDLLSWLPAAAIARTASLEVTPTPTAIRRAIGVRVELERGH
jgi:hypothetical protein